MIEASLQLATSNSEVLKRVIKLLKKKKTRHTLPCLPTTMYISVLTLAIFYTSACFTSQVIGRYIWERLIEQILTEGMTRALPEVLTTTNLVTQKTWQPLVKKLKEILGERHSDFHKVGTEHWTSAGFLWELCFSCIGAEGRWSS